MPQYTYGCQKCHYLFEVTHTVSETPFLPCPECGGLTEKKPNSQVNILKSIAVTEHQETLKQACTQIGPHTCAFHHYHPHLPDVAAD